MCDPHDVTVSTAERLSGSGYNQALKMDHGITVVLADICKDQSFMGFPMSMRFYMSVIQAKRT